MLFCVCFVLCLIVLSVCRFPFFVVVFVVKCMLYVCRDFCLLLRVCVLV